MGTAAGAVPRAVPLPASRAGPACQALQREWLRQQCPPSPREHGDWGTPCLPTQVGARDTHEMLPPAMQGLADGAFPAIGLRGHHSLSPQVSASHCLPEYQRVIRIEKKYESFRMS